MGFDLITEDHWQRLSDLIAQRTGLHFPAERRNDLKRSVAGVCTELGIEDAMTCVEWLLASPLNSSRMQVLASHLTVGETYFFREKKTFEALSDTILPELIRTRQRNGQYLRIWSAACCTGEEAYSLAILLHQMVPHIREWEISILATDLNQRFLEKAAMGIYNEWSFRGAEESFKGRYFERTAEGKYALIPEIKGMVTFAPLNLADDSFPSMATGVHAFDVIFCRNVLMYFTQAHAQRVVEKLHRSLVPEGWLVTSPSEGSHVLFSQFAAVNRPGIILYRRKREPRETSPAMTEEVPEQSNSADVWSEPAAGGESPADASTQPVVKTTSALPLGDARGLYDQGRYAETVEVLLGIPLSDGAPAQEVSDLLTRSLANQGKLAEALVWCTRWLEADNLNGPAHYLKGVILQELGDHDMARVSFRTAIYLRPDFIMAHFALGNLAHAGGQRTEAQRSFTNAARLARSLPGDSVLMESDGLTAGRLAEIVASLRILEESP